MKPIARIANLPLSGALQHRSRSSAAAAAALLPPPACLLQQRGAIHSGAPKRANVVPVYGTGPPPEPPVPSSSQPVDSRIAERRKKADMLKRAQELRAASQGKPSAKDKKAGALKKRFWKDVHVKEVDGAYEIHLDTRALRHPTTKAKVRLPLSKPNLAHALAVEWDMLVSAQQATRQHLIPLTSLVCRAIDIAEDDAAHHHSATSDAAGQFAPVRTGIATILLRYLDTDSLLCWSPPPDPLSHGRNADGASLRELQERAAARVVGFLSAHVWPGVEFEPVLDEDSIMPRQQKPGVREVVQGWIMGLEPWELAGLERAVLAGKSLLSASRLVAEWSEGAAGVASLEGRQAGYGVEEAAKATSIEVDWQIGNWGEVEDTHDVEKVDLRRQLGSVILLVSGSSRK
ncbi:uncharacterized protein E0L32_008387 [Thyridium curvatum]|uniref:Uncharacterized protein n=1 Tax=Thyridium curvatum TaxID=1093900 RepID=A0A507ASD4_9PEZI|nr:uncharacterized protein E0L32_008387 [Thyridium curvatum]TPX10653.1 hypothetical protein E0L32_008387 [Thyridium curvatum]